MKELYICIFEKFNISLQDAQLFDYNRLDDATTEKLQRAFSYYKAQSRDGQIMFMQFLRKLQSFGEQHSARVNAGRSVVGVHALRNYVFIAVCEERVMLIEDAQQQLYSFICLPSASGYDATCQFATLMANNYSINVDKGKCASTSECSVVSGPGVFTNCTLVFYRMSTGERDIIVANTNNVVFKNAEDPALLFGSSYVCVSPFVSAINLFVRNAKNIVTRHKSISEPVKPSAQVTEVITDEEKSGLHQRLKEFEKSLDEVLRRHNLLN